MISVLGAGCWGTGIANLMANNGHKVTVWARKKKVAEEINKKRTNKQYLPKAKLNKNIYAETSLEESIKNNELIFLVIPAQTVRSVCERIKETLKEIKQKFSPSFVVCAKGIEKNSLKLMNEVITEYFPKADVAILSGPNFAVEIVELLPAVTTVATKNKRFFDRIAKLLDSKSFKCHYSNDIVTTEVAGMMKNVVAIASGITVGLELGENAKASIIMQGFNEIGRFCDAMGGNKNNLNNAAGIGDIILTAGSRKSRNMSLGLEIGKGKKLEEILKGCNKTFEGLETSKSLIKLANKLGINVPLCKAVAKILKDNKKREEIDKIIRDIILM
ncbi:NAD(P)H-dependent glycerol-3-phosphate dehydrogenase [Pseudomonadota bacterium]